MVAFFKECWYNFIDFVFIFYYPLIGCIIKSMNSKWWIFDQKQVKTWWIFNHRTATKMINDTIKIIFLHGNGGSSPTDNWFPYAKAALEKLGFRVIARQFPDTHLALASSWLPFLKNELQADEKSVLVGHSSGALAAMRFAEHNKILGSVLVAAMYTDLGIESEKLSGYFDTPWNWESIKNNQKWIIQFASTDDPWIPIAEPRFVHKKLASDYYEFTDQGHFGGDYYKQTFPQLVEAIQRKLNKI